MDTPLNIDINEIENKHDMQQIKKSPIKSPIVKPNKKDDSIITKNIVKIYDVVEHNGTTYYCYKNKIYDNNKKLCGLINNKELRIFTTNAKGTENINKKYLGLKKNLINLG